MNDGLTYNVDASLKLTVLSMVSDCDIKEGEDRMELATKYYEWVRESMQSPSDTVTTFKTVQ